MYIGDDMNEEKLKVNIQIIINKRLFERKLIDKATYSIVNESLLRKLN